MVKEEQAAEEAWKALSSCLQDLPFVSRTMQAKPGMDEGPDLLVRVALPQGEQVLAVQVAGNGQPRHVRSAADRLLRLRESIPQAYSVVVAPYISAGSAAICAQEGIGYADLAGNCRLCFGQVYIQREGRPNPAAARRDLRSLYSPKAERVLRVLLADPGGPWKMQPLAAEARVSLGQAANVKKLLADREWIRVTRDGFALTEPEALLAEWADNYDGRRSAAADFYTLLSIGQVESELARICRQAGIRCALAGFSAAARLAPAVRYQRAMAFVAGNLERVADLLGLKPVTSGPNVRLLAPYDDGVFLGAQEVGDAAIVSPVQAYLDLRSTAGRGAEGAAALLQEVIKPQWQRRA